VDSSAQIRFCAQLRQGRRPDQHGGRAWRRPSAGG
jgi:hypothetical protein